MGGDMPKPYDKHYVIFAVPAATAGAGAAGGATAASGGLGVGAAGVGSNLPPSAQAQGPEISSWRRTARRAAKYYRKTRERREKRRADEGVDQQSMSLSDRFGFSQPLGYSDSGFDVAARTPYDDYDVNKPETNMHDDWWRSE